ncbi:MAG: FMN-binding protein [Blautia massiliensis (ex Durand et al. 2017)]
MENNQTPEKQSAVKELVLPVVVLVAICLVCSALLAVLNDVTAPIIEENTRAETLASYLSVLPEGTAEADMTELENLTTEGVQGAVTTASGAAAVKAAAAGYSGKDVTVYVAFDANGAIANLTVDASTQTTGIGSKVAEEGFTAGFIGWNGGAVSSGAPVDGIASATYSSDAVFDAVNAAIDCYNNEIKGGM